MKNQDKKTIEVYVADRLTDKQSFELLLYNLNRLEIGEQSSLMIDGKTYIITRRR